MEKIEIIEILRQHNAWRRCDDDSTQLDPTLIGAAIDAAIAALAAHAGQLKGWKMKWECAVEMAAQAEAKLEILQSVLAIDGEADPFETPLD